MRRKASCTGRLLSVKFKVKLLSQFFRNQMQPVFIMALAHPQERIHEKVAFSIQSNLNCFLTFPRSIAFCLHGFRTAAACAASTQEGCIQFQSHSMWTSFLLRSIAICFTCPHARTHARAHMPDTPTRAHTLPGGEGHPSNGPGGRSR